MRTSHEQLHPKSACSPGGVESNGIIGANGLASALMELADLLSDEEDMC